jgi:hypothetical protein
VCSLHLRFSFFEEKIKISVFDGISKSFKLIVFGQILTKFGRFGLFWADSTAMAVANSLKGKKENIITFAKSIRDLRMIAC